MSQYLWTSIEIFDNTIWISKDSLVRVSENNDDPLDGNICFVSYKFSLKRIQKVISAARNSGFEIGTNTMSRQREHPKNCYCLDCEEKERNNEQGTDDQTARTVPGRHSHRHCFLNGRH